MDELDVPNTKLCEFDGRITFPKPEGFQIFIMQIYSMQFPKVLYYKLFVAKQRTYYHRGINLPFENILFVRNSNLGYENLSKFKDLHYAYSLIN